jgi:hypothetical protein
MHFHTISDLFQRQPMRIVKCNGLLFTLPRAGNCAPEDIRTHVHDLAFRGSYSLKSVLPALVSGMSDDGMEVADGNEAGLAWEKMVHTGVGSGERKSLRDALMAYCNRDTLGMVRLLEVLAAGPHTSKGRNRHASVVIKPRPKISADFESS